MSDIFQAIVLHISMQEGILKIHSFNRTQLLQESNSNCSIVKLFICQISLSDFVVYSCLSHRMYSVCNSTISSFPVVLCS